MVRWVVGSILHGVDPLSYFSFQPVRHDWCNKGCGMCYPVCGMVHIKEPLLLIGRSSPCYGSGFPLSLSEWSFTTCLMPYNRKYNVLSASLNKTFPFLDLFGISDRNTTYFLMDPLTQLRSQLSQLFICFIRIHISTSLPLERDVTLWQERSLMVRWVVRLILHGGPIELFLVPASAP